MIHDFLRWVQRGLQAIGSGIVVRFREEPVLTLAMLQAGIAMFVAFGLGWSGVQVALTVAFLAAVLGWIARQEVTPNVKVDA